MSGQLLDVAGFPEMICFVSLPVIAIVGCLATWCCGKFENAVVNDAIEDES